MFQASYASGMDPRQERVASATSVISFTMPLPPSMNNAYRNLPRGGRAKTRATTDWEAHALWALKAQRLPVICGPVLIVFGFERPSASADADNRIKLAQDLIVKAGIIEDDRFVVGGAYAWLPASNGLAHVLVMPAQAITLDFHLAQDAAAGGWVLAASHHLEDT